MNKKIGLLASFILLIFALNFVSAYGGFYYDARNGMQQVIDGVVNFSQPLLQVLLGGDDWSGYLLFERFLIFVILISMVFISLKNIELFSSNKNVLWIISIGVPLMGIRFINFMWLNTILIQYQILAIAFTAGLPFIIYFLFLYKGLVGPEYGTLRKIAWVFFATIYLGLWSTGTTQGYPEVYLYTALLALLFFLFDGTLAKYFAKVTADKAISRIYIDQLTKLERRYNDIESSKIAIPNPADKKRELKAIMDEIREIQQKAYS
jgi:type IV secretory pathway VirB2 component (pilin)